MKDQNPKDPEGSSKPSSAIPNSGDQAQGKSPAKDLDLSEWLRKYRPLLKSIAAREIDSELGQKVDDSDVIQETLNAAQANIKQVADRNPKEIQGYLRRVLLSKIEDLRRRFLKTEKRDVRRELTTDEITSDEFRSILGEETSQLDSMIDEERFRKVMNAVRSLPDEIQKVLAWRFEHDMTFEQIGAQIGRSKDDVRMLINRCIARLRKQLDES
ncbi:MAG: sigma-70 family RNA polymerase sigma factor [Planctomycetaceae bacterium]|jgi:RNA polymerase sigma-70 factor (subfamily 1)|nr:sigma-70 family RNA polymerase sigma factor [Planctomycetaceae bacterium]